MLNLEIFAEKSAANIAQSLQLDEEKKAVMAYGIFCFLHILVSIFLVILVGFLCNVFWESLIISFTIAILRKYSGGAHAATPGQCLVIGTIISVVPAMVIAHISVNVMGVITLGTPVFAWAIYEVLTKAPVDSAKKPITNEKKGNVYETALWQF